MDQRKQMVLRLECGDLTVSGASREYGVSRQTVRLWRSRAQERSLGELCELSRRPKEIPNQSPLEIEERVLACKRLRPTWGAKKIAAVLWPEEAPVCVRTVDRILKRNGLVKPRKEAAPPATIRFEREEPNELWQMDFKGMGLRPPAYSPLSVLDDATRFCLAFEPLPNHRAQTIFSALWNLFGEYGMPEAILSDNEPCFAEISRTGPSWLEARLWLLGVRSLHGRPLHPQTQGKVERFHGTVKLDLGTELRQESITAAQARYALFVHEYNYERPHEAIQMQVPAKIYRPSPRKRPSILPEHEIHDRKNARKVDANGKFAYRSQSYRAGHGLAGQYIVVQETEQGLTATFAGRNIGLLNNLTA